MSEYGQINLTTTNDIHFRKVRSCGTDLAHTKNMKSGTMFDRSTINCAKNALDYLASRNRIVASNIANVSTPGYKTKDVSFESVLTAKQGLNLKLTRTNEKHFPKGFEGDENIEAVYAYETGNRFDGKNDVDLDKELLKSGEVQTNFTMFSEILKRKYTSIKDVINNNP